MPRERVYTDDELVIHSEARSLMVTLDRGFTTGDLIAFVILAEEQREPPFIYDRGESVPNIDNPLVDLWCLAKDELFYRGYPGLSW